MFSFVCLARSRSVAANSFDQIYCMQLAQNAVHGAMAGYTAFSVGVVNDRTVSNGASERARGLELLLLKSKVLLAVLVVKGRVGGGG